MKSSDWRWQQIRDQMVRQSAAAEEREAIEDLLGILWTAFALIGAFVGIIVWSAMMA